MTAPADRILIITTTFPRWADDPLPAPFVFHLARALAAHAEVTVLAPHFAGAATDENMEGVRVKRFRYAPEQLELISDGVGLMSHFRRSPLRALLALPLIAAEKVALVRELNAGARLINAHWLVPSGFIAAGFSLLFPMRLVITAHAADYDLLTRLPGGRWLLGWIVRRSRRTVAVSRRLADGLTAASGHPEKVLIRPMGVDTAAFAFNAEKREDWRLRLELDGAPTVLFVGKLTAKKGVEVLLRAAAKMDPATRMVIAGDGDQDPALKRMAGEMGIADRVRFLGALPHQDIAGLYSAADVVAVPSVRDARGETEGMPVVILEALAAGRPVAATSLCSAPPELIGRGVTEVPPGDTDALAAALTRAIAGESPVDLTAIKHYDVTSTAEFYTQLLLDES